MSMRIHEKKSYTKIKIVETKERNTLRPNLYVHFGKSNFLSKTVLQHFSVKYKEFKLEKERKEKHTFLISVVLSQSCCTAQASNLFAET